MIGCGAPDVPPTSIAAEGGDPDRVRVERALAGSLERRLGWELREISPTALGALLGSGGETARTGAA
jgi:hypothetical protein